MGHPFSPTLSGPGVCEAVFEISSIADSCSMSPQDLLFNAQDGVLDSGVRHGVHLQPSSACVHCQHVVPGLMGLWECDAIHLPGLPILIFQPLSPYHKGFTLGLLDCSTCFTVMDDLENTVCG